MLLKEYTMQKNESAKSAKEIVTEFIQALERKDFKNVRSYISDNISVVAPGPRPDELLSFNRAEPFIKYLEHANLPKLDIKKEFADSHDVCLLYEMNYREPPVTTFVCGWFQVDDDGGKISSLRFVVDPRALFEQKNR
jgi:limonene-1,2-epoxide hydrolase